MLWKEFVENQVKNNKMWMGLSERRNWSKYLFRGCQAGNFNFIYIKGTESVLQTKSKTIMHASL